MCWEFGLVVMIWFSWRIDRMTTMCCLAYDIANPWHCSSTTTYKIWAITCDVMHIHGEFKNKKDKSWGEQKKKNRTQTKMKNGKIKAENVERLALAAMEYQTRVTDFNFQSFNHCVSGVEWSEVECMHINFNGQTQLWHFFVILSPKQSHVHCLTNVWGARHADTKIIKCTFGGAFAASQISFVFTEIQQGEIQKCKTLQVQDLCRFFEGTENHFFFSARRAFLCFVIVAPFFLVFYCKFQSK